MNTDRRDGIWGKRERIHDNFDGDVFTEDGKYSDEYTEWLEDSIVNHYDGMIYNIDDFKNRVHVYRERLKDETLSDEKRTKLELKMRNMNSRVIGMETFGMGLCRKLLKENI